MTNKFGNLTTLVALIAILTCCESAAAQVIATQGRDLETPDEFVGDSGTVYEMKITPAAETVPAFKYRLTVPPHETIPGNAITHYLRSLGENSLNGPWEAAQEQFGMEVHEWYGLETKDEDIPLEDLRTACSYFDSYVDNLLRRATHCRDAEWGLAIEELSGPETLNFLLPSVQETRSMARLLSLRNRLAVIEGRFDDSVDHLRMTYQLGQHVNEMGYLVSNLVAAAEIGIANRDMIGLISAKDAPNMYWAMAELPRPILSFRRSLRLEGSWPQRYFSTLMESETAEHSEEEWKRQLDRVVDSIIGLQSQIGSRGQLDVPAPSNSLRNQALAMGAGLAGYSVAKQRLIDSGMDPDKVGKMPVAQVLLVDAARDCNYFAQEIEKTFYVPHKDVEAFDDRINEVIEKFTPSRMGAVMVGMLSPAIVQVHRAEKRIQAQIDVLMVIESIRHHVATKGELPESLDELELPIRKNLATDEPFPYRVENGTAILDLKVNWYVERFKISVAEKE